MKHFIASCLCLLFCSISVFSQNTSFQLSTHILDITEGKPAPNVKVMLEKQEGDKWVKMAEKTTNIDGRIADLLPLDTANSNKGIYRLTFFTKPYFTSKSMNSFYPFVEVSFELTDDSHYHVPITLSPYGYSTYRGS